MRENLDVSYRTMMFSIDANSWIGLNCEKNAVTCEGYPQKTIWKSGKERAEEGMAALDTTLPRYIGN